MSNLPKDLIATPTETLKNYWGYPQFRPLQEDIIHSILEGKDTLALLPTGGGKSLCYQVPAMCREGLCLVISPLIALMKDQVEQLRKKHITAFAIFSGMTRREVINTLQVAMESNCKFLYVSPERLETALFKEYLPALDIRIIAVDEAHCISQWGYDFRPSYLRIAALREELPDVPILALTASATPLVEADIMKQLSFTEKKVFRQSFERPNLSYSNFQTDSKINKIIDILNKVPGSSLVYCRSRKRTKEISDLLQLQGIKADFYHAGLTQNDRSRKQEEWVNNQTRTMVCTNAFGMGIDKPDVRIVIHADVPECLENYYQEAGRAGRDGKRSYAVLLFQDKEIEELKVLPETRYPPFEIIRSVYQSLVNYLQLPVNSGEGVSFDFSFPDFIKKFKLSTPITYSSLKALEQEGFFSFNEQVFIPSKVQFITGKEILYDFEDAHPELEPLIKILLRTYGGLFEQPTFIQESLLSYLLKSDKESIIKGLYELHQERIIAYMPQKDSPQLFFLQPRVAVERLQINEKLYKERKQLFSNRITDFIKYISDSTTCRSVIIAQYFGDNNVPPCGICDNCLEKKKAALTNASFDTIKNSIFNMLSQAPVTIDQLLSSIKGYPKEQVWKVIEFLQSENEIETSPEGKIRIRK